MAIARPPAVGIGVVWIRRGPGRSTIPNRRAAAINKGVNAMVMRNAAPAKTSE